MLSPVTTTCMCPTMVGEQSGTLLAGGASSTTPSPARSRHGRRQMQRQYGPGAGCRRRMMTMTPGRSLAVVQCSSSSPPPPVYFNIRRLLVGGASALAVSLGGNFLGITTKLLETNVDGARSVRLDVIYPVAGFKREANFTEQYEFIYPVEWLADQTVARRRAMRLERPLDLPALNRSNNLAKSRSQVVEPTVAYGPVGSTGEENVSVVIANSPGLYDLRQLGDPSSVGKTLISRFAPPGSDRTGELVSSKAVILDDIEYYQIEYTVESQRRKFSRHNIAVCAVIDQVLYTLNVQVPRTKWNRRGSHQRYFTIADSFRVLPRER